MNESEITHELTDSDSGDDTSLITGHLEELAPSNGCCPEPIADQRKSFLEHQMQVSDFIKSCEANREGGTTKQDSILKNLFGTLSSD